MECKLLDKNDINAIIEGFNRYIVECKFNVYCACGGVDSRFNRYIVECKSQPRTVALVFLRI